MSAGFFSNVTCQTSPYIMTNQDLSHKNNSTDFNNILPTPTPNNISIRRTLSADMSSPKWLQNNGFNLKKVHSSQHLQALGEENNHGNNSDHDDQNKGPAFEDIWSSIQADKRSWGSILSDGSGSKSGSGQSQLPAPYVHPLAKRRASSLSEKSLEICTESLGSETGSDGFSYSSSEPDDSDKEHEQEVEEEKEKEKEQQEVVVEVKRYNFSNLSEVSNCKYNNNKGPTSKRSMMVPPGRPSFPPPLPSLANRDDGSNLHIRSHRQDGRLVVEAVSVPSQNCFRAQRQDGRLLLTLTPTDDEQEQDDVVEDDEVVVEDEVDEKLKDEEQKTGIVMLNEYDHEIGEEELEVVNVQRSCPTLTMTMSKLLNKSTWPRDYNKNIIKTLDDVDEEIDVEEAEITVSSQTLLPQPRVSTATAALNAYEYYWRRSNSNDPSAAAVAVLSQLAGQQNNNIYTTDAPQVGKDTKGNNKHLLFAAHNRKGGALPQQEVVLVKAAGRRGGTTSTEEKGEYLVPFMLRGCKDHNKSFFLLDPYCIATS